VLKILCPAKLEKVAAFLLAFQYQTKNLQYL